MASGHNPRNFFSQSERMQATGTYSPGETLESRSRIPITPADLLNELDRCETELRMIEGDSLLDPVSAAPLRSVNNVCTCSVVHTLYCVMCTAWR